MATPMQIPPVAQWKFGEILHIPDGNKRYIPISFDGGDLIYNLASVLHHLQFHNMILKIKEH